MVKRRTYEVAIGWGIGEFLQGECGWAGGENEEITIIGIKRTKQCYNELMEVLDKYRE